LLVIRARSNPGVAMAVMTLRMATTISNSSRVNP